MAATEVHEIAPPSPRGPHRAVPQRIVQRRPHPHRPVHLLVRDLAGHAGDNVAPPRKGIALRKQRKLATQAMPSPPQQHVRPGHACSSNHTTARTLSPNSNASSCRNLCRRAALRLHRWKVTRNSACNHVNTSIRDHEHGIPPMARHGKQKEGGAHLAVMAAGNIHDAHHVRDVAPLTQEHRGQHHVRMASHASQQGAYGLAETHVAQPPTEHEAQQFAGKARDAHATRHTHTHHSVAEVYTQDSNNGGEGGSLPTRGYMHQRTLAGLGLPARRPRSCATAATPTPSTAAHAHHPTCAAPTP